MALPGSTTCNRGNFIEVGESRSLSCACVNGRKMLHHLPSAHLKHYNVFLGTTSKHCWHQKLQIRRTLCFVKASRLLSLQACQVKGKDSEEILSGESILMDEQTLLRDLQTAIEGENYAEAAKIRDSLRLLQEDSKASILAVNARFYNAFRKGDLAAMQDLWARADKVCCVHPGASGVLGYEDVMESWEVVWMNYDFPLEIELKNVVVHFRGDVGYVSCVEFVRTKGSSWGAQYVTNVFEKIDGQWFICIHHASPVDL